MQTYVIEQMLGRGQSSQQFSDSGMEQQTGKLDLPLDICEWVSPDTLASWVEEEVEKLGTSAPMVTPLFRTLRALLAFAYARGVFDSEDILRLAQSDPPYKRLTSGVDFTIEHLFSVRFRERGFLVTLTVRLLSRALAEKTGTPASAFTPQIKRRLHENAVDRLDNARNMDRGESA